MRPAEIVHPHLPPLHLVNQRTQEYVGACPFCGGDDASDRFHVWMTASGSRPARRFWCRHCGEKGLLDARFGADHVSARDLEAIRRNATRLPPPAPGAGSPRPEHIPHYRQLYALVALWAHANLLDPANPDPLAAISRRGLSPTDAQRHVLGYGLHDPQSLVEYLRQDATDLMPYAEEAGVLVRDHSGQLRAHWNLCGALVFPYIVDSEVVDIRMRRPGPGHKTKSLPGSYDARGATMPMGWDTLAGATHVLLTESGEFKALVPQAAYEAGTLSLPTLGHPGLTNFRPAWGQQLLARGVRCVTLAYDSQPRPVKDGIVNLAPEEAASIRHGQALAAAGLEVRVLRLPLAPGETKADLDDFLLRHGPQQLQALIDQAPLLADYHLSLPQPLLERAHLPAPLSYPTRRARPRRITTAARADNEQAAPISLDIARQQIADLVHAHAMGGSGVLVLAHPPGAGKGHNTADGLNAFLRDHPSPGPIIWTALRKDQHQDQQSLPLIPLHGRNPGNCRKFAETQVLTRKGYGVLPTLCQRRCPHLDYCAYLRQFTQEGDLFAPLPLLQATRWWADAGVVVLDEFDPARLTRTVSLSLADMAAMGRATTCPHAQAVLGWLAQVLSTTLDRTLSGALLYTDLVQVAAAEGRDFWASVEQAIAALPPPEEQALLPGFPAQAALLDYESLPPGYLATLLEQIGREGRKGQGGQRYTSRLEARSGTLQLYLRIEHLIAQLARPEQPKIILDASANAGLLRAIFPQTPVRVEQPVIAGAMRVVQVISRDWAKSTLRGKRREQWYDAVAAQIRPDRKTLVVCTLECEDDLRQALAARGHTGVALAHYGAVRGTNAYIGHDVVLAQVYHPNLEQVIREGRALFADDDTPLDERVVTVERTLTDGTGASWNIQVPTFADTRLAALIESRREHELVQAALRGRPLDHPDTQISLLFGLPLPGLRPTVIAEAPASRTSNAGRQAAAQAALLAAAQQLLEGGARQIDVQTLASHAGVSVVTVRTHWGYIATRLHLKAITQRRRVALPNGGSRSYARAVLLRRGRVVPRAVPQQIEEGDSVQAGMDHARNHVHATRLICRVPLPTRVGVAPVRQGARLRRRRGWGGWRAAHVRYRPPW
jgi:hypothetical protein